jgi:osmotically inducible protein OsmC
MAQRTARTAWNGGLEDGSGQVELTTSKVGTFDVSWPRRAGEDAAGVTSPEELIAAAHSSCFSMQLSALIAAAGGTPQSLDVTAEVGFGPDKGDGGFRLTGIALTVVAEVEGLDDEAFQKAAQDAKAGCPVSKALTGVEITLDASLAT